MSLELELCKPQFPSTLASWLPVRFCQGETERGEAPRENWNVGGGERGLPTSFPVSVSTPPTAASPCTLRRARSGWRISHLCSLTPWATLPRPSEHPLDYPLTGPNTSSRASAPRRSRHQSQPAPFPRPWALRHPLPLSSSQPRVGTAPAAVHLGPP